MFDYHVDLTTGFLAQAGTSYWLSIFSNSSSFSPLWGWRSGSGGDGASFQDNLNTGVGTAVASDRAFALLAPVPGPSAIVLVILVLSVVALRHRR